MSNDKSLEDFTIETVTLAQGDIHLAIQGKLVRVIVPKPLTGRVHLSFFLYAESVTVSHETELPSEAEMKRRSGKGESLHIRPGKTGSIDSYPQPPAMTGRNDRRVLMYNVRDGQEGNLLAEGRIIVAEAEWDRALERDQDARAREEEWRG